MFIKGWVRTLLIWAGLILLLLLNTGVIGYGEPYSETVGGFIYTSRDVLPYYYFLYVLAVAFGLTGCYIWTRLKNRHWAFLLWGLLSPVGLLGIACLKDKSVPAQSSAGVDRGWSRFWLAKLGLSLSILTGFVLLVAFGHRVFSTQHVSVWEPIVLLLCLTAWVVAIRLSAGWWRRHR